MHFEGKILVELNGNIATPHWRERIPRLPSFDTRTVDSDTPIETVIENWVERYGR
jgi:hypothetical protein